MSENYTYFEKQFDEKIELNEGALFDARQVAEEANHKYEETERKVKIVTHQLACIIERAEDFEANSRETEIKVRVSRLVETVGFKCFYILGFTRKSSRNGTNQLGELGKRRNPRS